MKDFALIRVPNWYILSAIYKQKLNEYGKTRCDQEVQKRIYEHVKKQLESLNWKINNVSFPEFNFLCIQALLLFTNGSSLSTSIKFTIAGSETTSADAPVLAFKASAAFF